MRIIHKRKILRRRLYLFRDKLARRQLTQHNSLLPVLQTMSFLRPAFRTVLRPRRVVTLPSTKVACRPQIFAIQRAAYSASAGLSSSDIQTRILDVLKSFEKVDPGKVSLNFDHGNSIQTLFSSVGYHFDFRGRPWVG